LTRKLYWEDMYLREFEAKVVSVEGQNAVLEQTAFNPRGGGLVSDTGTINGTKVVEATKEGDEVVHRLEFPPDFAAGDVVKGRLDWDRRYRVMRMHTTAHIISSVVNGETGALITGNQIRPEESRVDFDLEQFDREKMGGYIEKVNDLVGRNADVKTYFLQREEAMKVPGLVKLAKAAPPTLDVLRIVQIGDIDTQADGGVHVANTREIGTVLGLRSENKGKTNRRLYFTVS
jgi:Ser-tRNA(Ala) deacylase AlaX